ncbi:MAG: carboxylating nicotinate-nucleotide diphosphorylase [Chromatiales bacterium]|nr:MAG: carboxylating nicotinate-nucleotide diphosphorylase [Chromatiales bacterium]
MPDADIVVLPPDIDDQVRHALREDVGSGDLTAALVPAGQRVEAAILTRQNAVICGQAWVERVFGQVDPAIRVQWQVAEAQSVASDALLCRVTGAARGLLTAERTALNFLQMLSGTATAAREYVDAVAGTGARILDTRKTVPGLRLAQKYAVRCGGADNHRIGLYDAILVKENHIAAAGSIRAAASKARATGVFVEIEVERLAQMEEALQTGADRLLLDNFTLETLRDAVEKRNSIAPGVQLEASGGITLANVRSVAETGVDFISVGAITKHVRAVDLSMRFQFAD